MLENLSGVIFPLARTQNPVRATSCRFDSDLRHLENQRLRVLFISHLRLYPQSKNPPFSPVLDQEWIIQCPAEM